MAAPIKYKVVGGPMSGQECVPTAPGMKRHPDARPIKASDDHPLAHKARAEAEQDVNEEWEPRVCSFDDGDVVFYSPKSVTKDQALRQLGFTGSQIANLDREELVSALEHFTGGK